MSGPASKALPRSSAEQPLSRSTSPSKRWKDRRGRSLLMEPLEPRRLLHGDELMEGSAVFRINAGGSPIADTVGWEGDEQLAPSPYSNIGQADSRTYSTTKNIDLAHPSIPDGTPIALFQTERWDTPFDAEMQWDFPVHPGTYEVRLYLAELVFKLPEQRLFDVYIEGQRVLEKYDVVAKSGGRFKGIVESIIVTSDENLDIDFARVVENPAIHAIEILRPDAPLDTMPPTVVHNTGAVVQEESAIVIGSEQLTYVDDQQGASGVLYAITGVPGNGRLERTYNRGQPITEFTQTDVNNGLIRYVHDGSETEHDTFRFSVSDGQGNVLPGQAFEITVLPVNDPPQLAPLAHPVLVEGSFQTIPITAEDPEGDPVTLWGENLPGFASVVDLGGGRGELRLNPAAGQTGRYTNLVIAARDSGSPAHTRYQALSVTVTLAGLNVASYNLIDADTDQTIGPLTDGDVIDLRALPSRVNIEALVSAGVQSVRFALNGKSNFRVENTSPYALFGDKGGDFYSWAPTPGHYTLTTTPYPFDLAQGTPGTTSTLSFQLVQPPASDTTPPHLSTNAGSTARAGLDDPIERTELEYADNQQPPSSVHYRVTSPLAHGQLEFTTEPAVAVNQFTQADIDAARLVYRYDGSNATSDRFEFSVDDGLGNVLDAQAFNIAIVGPPASIGFGKSILVGINQDQAPTTLQWGPDERLYLGRQNGHIEVYSITRNGPNDYTATLDETITLIASIPNHNDDGTPNTRSSRLMTGILVTGTSEQPVIYAGSSDPRIGGGSKGDCQTNDKNLDTNSGIISRLTWDGSAWQKVDLVRGLPRSEENHATNGIILDALHNRLLVAQGGNTNMGAPSNNFACLPEYALSGAILSIDLTQIDSLPDQVDIDGTVYKYDLPTLDDETRDFDGHGSDVDLAQGIQDVFGGNDGRNQAVLTPDGPVQIYSPGYRNAYDLVLTRAGFLYTIDNGANAGWGDVPVLDPNTGLATNQINEPGVTTKDNLQLVSGPGYYGGHPNPTRANVDNTFNESNPQSPVARVGANSIESFHQVPQSTPRALRIFNRSTNGIVEYTASNFGGAMDGDLLAVGFFGANEVYRMKLSPDGQSLPVDEVLFSNVGIAPLDVWAIGDNGSFPGTIWVADWAARQIVVFEPDDFSNTSPVGCPGDDDCDGYPNEYEQTNGDNPNSAAAMFSIVPGDPNDLNASTYVGRSFQLANQSSAGERITSATLEIDSALFPDMVFDPFGAAGDSVAADLAQGGNEGFVGFAGHTWFRPHDEGYDAVDLTFNDFDPGEVFKFRADIDPTSIRGSAAPGPQHAGDVSGLELVGARITVHFDDGNTLVGETFPISGSVAHSTVLLRPQLPPQPHIQIQGLEVTPAIVSQPQQTVRISGPAGKAVSLIVVEGGLFTAGVPGGGFDIDPFEANRALGVSEYPAVIGSNGYVDVPIVLTRSDWGGEKTGINHIAAVIKEPDGRTSVVSARVVLEYHPAAAAIADPDPVSSLFSDSAALGEVLGACWPFSRCSHRRGAGGEQDGDIGVMLASPSKLG